MTVPRSRVFGFQDREFVACLAERKIAARYRAAPLVAIRHAAGVGHRRKVEINMRPLIASWLRAGRVHLPSAALRSRDAFPVRRRDLRADTPIVGVPTPDPRIYILRSAGPNRFRPVRAVAVSPIGFPEFS